MLSKTGVHIGVTGKGNPVIINPLSNVLCPLAVYHRRSKILLDGISEFKKLHTMPSVKVINLTDGTKNVGLLTQQAKGMGDGNVVYIYSNDSQLPHIQFACIIGPAQIILYHGHIRYDLQV